MGTKIQIDSKQAVFDVVFDGDEVDVTIRPNIIQALAKAVMKKGVVGDSVDDEIDKAMVILFEEMNTQAEKAVGIASSRYVMPSSFFSTETKNRLVNEIDQMVREAYQNVLFDAAINALNEIKPQILLELERMVEKVAKESVQKALTPVVVKLIQGK